MEEEFDSSEDQIYYIVSTKFIEEWIAFCESSNNRRLAPKKMNFDIY